MLLTTIKVTINQLINHQICWVIRGTGEALRWHLCGEGPDPAGAVTTSWGQAMLGMREPVSLVGYWMVNGIAAILLDAPSINHF